ncbi:MAG: hypothetical protein KOO62_08470 [candidate division Zixibacteria bacterium]|nr:hypothetical protein [candidate division Zixibacteria bacterium]
MSCLCAQWLWLLISFLVMGASVSAEFYRGQSVTWSNFSHIRQITASVSHVYFLTTRGIIIYDKEQDVWKDPFTNHEGLDDWDIQRIWVDNFGDKLFVATSTDLLEYDMLIDKWFEAFGTPDLDKHERHIPPPSIMYAPAGFHYDGGTGHLVDSWARFFQFVDVLDDGSGELWIGAWDFGVLTAGSISHRLELLPFGLLQDRVNTIYQDDGVLWVSGAITSDSRSGLTRFDLDGLEFSYVESGVRPEFPGDDVNCLTGDDDHIYIGTPLGLHILDRQTERVSRSFSTIDGLNSGNVLSILAFGDTLFVGTAEGLAMIMLDGDSSQVVRPTQFANAIVYDLELVNGSIWIASSIGFYRIKLGTGEIQRYIDPDHVLFGDGYDIEVYDQYLWFLADGGLVQLDTKTAESRSYQSVTERLTANDLAVNDTIAVVGTNNGFTILFHANNPPYTRDFTTADGLPSNYIYSVVLDCDYLWLGSDKGLTRFLWNNPERVD